MGNTTIGWTATIHDGIVYPGYTLNLWIGCTKVSDGCANCYAERLNKRHKWVEGWGESFPRNLTKTWKNVYGWNKEAERSGVRRKVFCASLSDVCDDHPSIEDQWHTNLISLVKDCTSLDFLFLTKRIDNFTKFYSELLGQPNLWLGITVENQKKAGKIHTLLCLDIATRFISIEPMLEQIDLTRCWYTAHNWLNALSGQKGVGTHILHTGDILPSIDWVIVGGESGPIARPMHPDWARSVRDQCQRECVPFYFKQWGTWTPITEHMDDFDTARFYSWQDSGAGRTDQRLLRGNNNVVMQRGVKDDLDGRTYHEYPEEK